MNIEKFLDYLKSLKIKLVIKDNKLKCIAPSGVMSVALQNQIKKYKTPLLEFLQQIPTTSNNLDNILISNNLHENFVLTAHQYQIKNPNSKFDEFPFIIKSSNFNINLNNFIKENRESIKTKIFKYGAIIFRDFQLNDISEFARFIEIIADKPMSYLGESVGAKTRKLIYGDIYQPTDIPPDDQIFLHNECSFSYIFPLKIFFYCLKPAIEGGETPIADSRRVLQRIPDSIRKQFLEKGVMYRRNYTIGQWQKAFQTTDQKIVEQHCEQAKTNFCWLTGDRLRTWCVRDAIVKHPYTRDLVWFNHTYQANVASVNSKIKKTIKNTFQLEDLPRNTYYGDGKEIESSVLNAIREAYEREKILFTWQKGDILMLDNMLISHGRESFTPPRELAVGMGEPFSRQSMMN